MPIHQWLTGLLLPASALTYLGAGLAGAALIPLLAAGAAQAKTPGATYCFHGTCHRVKTVPETEALIGREELLQASFYDDCSRDRYNPCGLTSSGEMFRPHDADNAASPIFPDGTTLLVRNPENQETAVVRVNNAGPYWGKRKLDVSIGVAEKLGFRKRGVAALEVRVVKAPQPSETRYRKHRVYDAVPGYVGRFASADTATAGVTAVMALESLASALVQPVAVLASLAEGNDPGASSPGGETKVAATIKIRIATRVARSGRGSKATKYASSRKGYGKRRTASARGKGRYASLGSKRTKGRYASKARALSRKLASAERGSRAKRRYAAYRGVRTSKAKSAWSTRDGQSKAAARSAKRLARL